MVKYPTILNLPQEDINRQLYEMILKLQKGETGETADITALKTTVGDANGGLVKSVAGIETAIGDEDTPATILYRIKALEDAH